MKILFSVTVIFTMSFVAVSMVLTLADISGGIAPKHLYAVSGFVEELVRTCALICLISALSLKSKQVVIMITALALTYGLIESVKYVSYYREINSSIFATAFILTATQIGFHFSIILMGNIWYAWQGKLSLIIAPFFHALYNYKVASLPYNLISGEGVLGLLLFQLAFFLTMAGLICVRTKSLRFARFVYAERK